MHLFCGIAELKRYIIAMRAEIILSLIAVHAVISSAQTIALTAEKEVYLEDDVRALHEAIFAPSGERVVLSAVIDGMDWSGPGCPLLTELVRLPPGRRENLADIRAHVQGELAQPQFAADPELLKNAVETLVLRSEGVFLYPH